MKVDKNQRIEASQSGPAAQRFSDLMGATPPPMPKKPADAFVGAAKPGVPANQLHPLSNSNRPTQPISGQKFTPTVKVDTSAAKAMVAKATANGATRQVMTLARKDLNGQSTQLGQTRASASQVATRMSDERSEAITLVPVPRDEVMGAAPSARDQEPIDARMVKLICAELTNDGGPKPANQDQPSASTLPFPVQTVSAHPASQPASAAQAVALIEKIETFVKSQRPALSLTLNNSLGARVEIERIGPREVALKLVGKDGPPNADDVGRIREAMKARGLKVGALSVG